MNFKFVISSILFVFLITKINAQPIKVDIIIDEEAPIINKHIYGHFAEHLGRCIYDGFYVGEGSVIPNTNGVRNDIIEALKDLDIPNLRWPGGCFADTYHWKDGIGPKEDRPSIMNIWWGNVTEDNSYGTHDFLNMCELLDTEPYISANVGSGTVQELADWMSYTTLPEGASPMSDLRAQNGRKEPWNVKFWGVGNEAWGCGGNMTPEYYADEYRKFATFMRAGNDVVRIASGASSGDYNWTEVLMKNIKHNLVEAVALHHYSVIDWSAKGPASSFTENQYFTTMKRGWEMEELINNHVAIMDKYDPEGKIDLYVDEWGGWYDVEPGTNGAFLYQQNTMRDAMLAGMTLNIFNNHADRVKMANIAQAVNVLQAMILTENEKMILTPTYHVFKMFKVHQDAQLIPLAFTSPDYEINDESLPALTVSASRTDNGHKHITIVNIDSRKQHKVEIDLSELAQQVISAEILQADKIQAHNTFTKPNNVRPKEYNDVKLRKGKLTMDIPPVSVIVIELK